MRIPYELPTASDFRRAVEAREKEIERRNRDSVFQAALAATRAEAAGAARILKEQFGATRVRLFGSLGRGDAGDEFDVDLAVEGIAPGRFFEACAAARNRISRKTDIIDITDATPLLKKRVDQDGVDLP